MGRKNAQKVTEVTNTNVSLIPTLRPAEMDGVNTNVAFDPTQLPEGFQGVTLEVVQTGFNPSPIWSQSGDSVAGVFTGMESEVGPNHAKLYNFETLSGLTFSVWGNTVLDRAFAQGMASGVIATGRLMLIMYVGTTPSKYEANPTKLFQVSVAKRS